MEYTELELNKMIAELEGENKIPSYSLLPASKNYHNWMFLGPLMVKYKVEISHTPEGFSRDIFGWVGIQGLNEVFFKSESEIQRAIIMCILKSENII